MKNKSKKVFSGYSAGKASNYNHFVQVPQALHNRSKFNQKSRRLTSMNAGFVVPIFRQEVLPGDTFDMSTSFVIRPSSALLAPVMDNSYIDINWFFVRYQTIWDKWKSFMGENTKSKWYDSTKYTVPKIKAPLQGGWEIGSLADHLGIPTGVPGLEVSQFPFRAYAKIMNEYYRDQNLQDPILELTDSANIQGVQPDYNDILNTVVKGGSLYPVNKYKDMFTTALPSPQKGPDVHLALLGEAPLAVNDLDPDDLGSINAAVGQTLRFYGTTDDPVGDAKFGHTDNGSTLGTQNQQVMSIGNISEVSNLYVDLSNATAGTINDIRYAFQLQKLFERDARGGSRYVEMLFSHFGVVSPDATQQRAELLGSSHNALQVHQVGQTSSSQQGSTPLATVAAFGLTGAANEGRFVKSFTEHGVILGLASIRTDHTYQYGLDRELTHFDRTDFFDPVFENLGEQPIRMREIFAQGTAADDKVFGYQEAWYQYRFKNNSITGAFRSSNPIKFDQYHYGDKYDSAPVLGDQFVRETPAYIDRTLFVDHSKQDQFIADFLFENVCTRPMKMYSVPGNIDRN